MRPWGRLHVSLKAITGHDELELSMGSTGLVPNPDPCDATAVPAPGATPDVLATVAASTYGFAADGQWHHLEIPLSDFLDLDLSRINIGFSIARSGGIEGDELLIDNLYFTP
jgi:hypothetical protein